jgi:hypothetical protein
VNLKAGVTIGYVLTTSHSVRRIPALQDRRRTRRTTHALQKADRCEPLEIWLLVQGLGQGLRWARYAIVRGPQILKHKDARVRLIAADLMLSRGYGRPEVRADLETTHKFAAPCGPRQRGGRGLTSAHGSRARRATAAAQSR